MKTCICGRKNIQLTKRVKATIIKDLITIYDEDGDEDVRGWKESLSKSLNSVGDIMEWMRDKSWDLVAAQDFLSSHLPYLEKDDIKHGSCQNIDHRTAAALVYYYNVPLNCFFEWCT